MPTRFEAWRDKLTPVEAVELYATRRFCKYKCPARECCMTTLTTPGTQQCTKVFMRWAVEEANGDAGTK